MKSKINSRSKGANGERELAGVLSSFGFAARRGQQRSGVDSADVIDGPPGWHFEVKRVERLNLWQAFAQAQRDAPNGETPLVAARRNHGPWLAIVDLRVLLGMIAGRSANATGSPVDDRRPVRPPARGRVPIVPQTGANARGTPDVPAGTPNVPAPVAPRSKAACGACLDLGYFLSHDTRNGGVERVQCACRRSPAEQAALDELLK